MTTEERLAKVERELDATKRRSRWLLAALAVAFGVWVLAGILGGRIAVNEVRARRLVLVDDEGQERAALDVIGNGPGLTLLDAAGNCRAMLAVTAEEPWLTLFDAAQKPRAALEMTPNGPRLTLADETGKTRALLAVAAHGPGLYLNDAAGEAIWSAP